VLVTRVIGDCPRCGQQNCFGNVSVSLQGCEKCNFRKSVWLPPVRKKIIYLDHFFYTNTFKGQDQRFIRGSQRITQATHSQLLVAPYSSIHEDEVFQWQGANNDLMEFVKKVSLGHKFERPQVVERTQIMKAFGNFLHARSPEYLLEERDVLPTNVHQWNDYFWINIEGYLGDPKQIESIKKANVEGLVKTYENWRNSTRSFNEHINVEIQHYVKSLFDGWFDTTTKILQGDHHALLSPSHGHFIISGLLMYFPDDTAPQESLKKVADFFKSEYFSATPYQWISTRMFAKLRDQVINGAYPNPDKVRDEHSGLIHDIQHISTYLPYCDVFILDKAMHAILSDPKININDGYKTEIFSLNNWEIFYAWVDELELAMSDDHKQALKAAYG